MVRRKQLARSWRRSARTRSTTIPGGSGPSAEPGRADAGGAEPLERGKGFSWEPLRIERVCEVKYDHLQGDRFRHATMFLRWRPDKSPEECRYDQLEVTPPYELRKVFSSGIERLLSRPELGRHVLQIDPDPGPGG